jgi:signal transduction histidine kinase
MRMTERQLNVLLAGALLALAPLAWLQYRWISEVSEVDQQRRQGALRAALERIAVRTDEAAGQIHTTLIGRAGGENETLEERLANFEESEGTVPLRQVLRILASGEGWKTEAWDAGSKKMVPTATPGWWSVRTFREGPILVSPPAILGPAFDEDSGVEGFVVLLLDARRVETEFLPRLLVEQSLQDEFLKEYSIRVARLEEETYGDLTVSVFRRISRSASPAGRKGPPGRRKRSGGFRQGDRGMGPWMLVAVHQGGSLEDVVERTRRGNLVVSGATLLLLAMALAGVGHALRRSQRLARLQLEFTAGVSHELRTPLAVIVSAGDNLAGGFVADPDKVKEYGALVREEGTRLTGMVDQVLRFSELEADRMPLERRPISVADVMANLEREMRSAAEQQGCVWEASYEDGVVMGDAAALHVAVRNLAENAIRHGGGAWIGVRAAKVGKSFVFTIEDRGPGIPPADLPHLFEPFFRGSESRARQRKGSGLGLALVERIARAHGGSVTAANKAGGGARFTLTIPGE